MNRRLARIRTVQALYQIEMTEVSPAEAMASVLEEDEEDYRNNPFFESLVKGTTTHLEEIDRLIQGALEHWTLSRISRVDRAILRMAVYEMKYENDIPVNVSINEAIDLAKGFTGEEEPGKFANGVLSNIAKMLES
ncbi:transcription antitermination factor NusB [Salipaludibacillus sp. CUR1]|uniref:transcription antitermination factor NusB n=1 Tax=Salipaludibacillus sp. CUR1 TaxID=2820003 RepID=UPI001E5CC4B9|nr:transcription antitermination factor NusB [Salipaludibacillus sp. CUR1]MCE7794330.1 transcription antitermination factor NusB [Salipaludibacillus sp. CUR1]